MNLYKFEDNALQSMEEYEYDIAVQDARECMTRFDALPFPLRRAVSITHGKVPEVIHPDPLVQACQILEHNQHRIVEKRNRK